MPYINAKQESYEIDKSLKAINDCQNADNNDLVAYLKDGAIAFDTYAHLFTITELEED